MVSKALALKNYLPTERFLEIRYEEFVKNPVFIGNKIREFLEVPDSKSFQNSLKKGTFNFH